MSTTQRNRLNKVMPNSAQSGIKSKNACLRFFALSFLGVFITGVFLCAVTGLISYEQEDAKTAFYKSPLVWTSDGTGDYLLPVLFGGAVHELTNAIDTARQVESITAVWEFDGEVSLEISADNGRHYAPAVYGLPVTSSSGLEKGNQIKWRVTMGPESVIQKISIAYTDQSGMITDFGSPLLSGFNKRKPMSIINSSDSDLYNYQVKIELREKDIDTQADFVDIRWTAGDGKTVLTHYLESITGYSPERKAVFYVKIPYMPKGSFKCYVYYGNAYASDISDAQSVFDIYDDFSLGIDSAKWETQAKFEGSHAVEGSLLRLDAARIISKDFQLENGIIEYRAKSEAGYEARAVIKDDKKTASLSQLAYSSNYEGAEHCIVVGNIVKSNTQKPIQPDTFYDFRVTVLGDSIKFERFGIGLDSSSLDRPGDQNDGNAPAMTGEPEASVIYDNVDSLSKGYIGLEAGGTGNGESTASYGWIRVRKCAEPAPSAGTLGNEEGVSPAVFDKTSLTQNGNITLSSYNNEYYLSGRYTTSPIYTACNISAITPVFTVEAGFGRADDFAEIDVSADGGITWKANCSSGITYTAPDDFKPGKHLLLRANLTAPQERNTGFSSAVEIPELGTEYYSSPVITSENITCLGATGKSGLYVNGDTMVIIWNNSAKGDNNPDIIKAVCNLSAFGGSSNAEMTDANNENIYTVKYLLPDGLKATANIYVTVTNACGTATRDGHILSADTTIGAKQEAEQEEVEAEAEEKAEEQEAEEEEAPAQRNLNKRYKIKFGKDEAEIGDFKTKEFKPHAKLKRWEGESSFSIEFPESKVPDNKKSVDLSAVTNRVEWDSPELYALFYKKGTEQVNKQDAQGRTRTFTINENGGLEFELVLKDIPVSNVISFPIESEGLKFYYQGLPTEQELAAGVTRPDEIIGSYAVYHESKRGGKYMAGKAFHIYRPKIIAADGNWTWGQLKIEEIASSPSAPRNDVTSVIASEVEPSQARVILRSDSDEGSKDLDSSSLDRLGTQNDRVLTITIDRDWLDNAAYPVIVDPTFGYDTQGASSITLQNIIRGRAFGMGDTAMDVDTIGVYLENIDAISPRPAKCALYLDSDSSLITDAGIVSVPVQTAGWYLSSLTTQQTLTAYENYTLAAWGNHANMKIYFDDLGGEDGRSDSETYGTWPDPASFTPDSYTYSIYASEVKVTFDITATLDETVPDAVTLDSFTAIGNTVNSNEVNSTNTGFYVNFTSPASEYAGTAHLYVDGALFATDLTKTVSAGETEYYGTENGIVGNLQSIYDLGADGEKALTVRIHDAAGNIGTASNTKTITKQSITTDAFNITATLDASAPTAAITYSGYTGSLISVGDLITITATFSEPMLDSPVPQIAISGENTLSATNMTKTDSTHYYYVHTVGPGEGTATVTLSTGTDPSGNEITSTPTSGAEFTVNSIHCDFNITYTLDETLPDAPLTPTFTATGGTVNTDEVNLTNTGFTVSFTSPSSNYAGTAHLYVDNALFATDLTVEVSAGDTSYDIIGDLQSIYELGQDGTKTLTVKIHDAAGNISTASTGHQITKQSITTTTFNITYTLDEVLPYVSSVVLDPVSPVEIGTAIDFTITFNEDMDTAIAPTVKFGIDSPYTTYTVTAKSGTGYTNGFQDTNPDIWEGTASADDTVSRGTYHLSISGAKDSCSNEMATDTSDEFILFGGFENIVIEGLSPYCVGEERNIQWTAPSAIDNVKITYSINSGANYDYTVTESTDNDNSYTWTVPYVSVLNQNVMKLKIEQANDPTNYNESALFTISTPVITVTAPDGGEDWYAKSLHDITWETQGAIKADSINLYYSHDSGTGYSAITGASALANSPQAFEWQLPFEADYVDTNVYKVKAEAVFPVSFANTTATEFTAGTLTDTEVTGTGDGAGVALEMEIPDPLILTGSFDTPHNARGVYVSGDYAYIADYSSGLQIIDISTPSSPSLAGTYDTPGSARGVYASGDYAYVADYNSGLQIIDISTPSSPSLVGTYNTSGYAYGVYVSGNYAYVADYESGLQIIDISTLSSPSLAGTYNTSGSANGVYVSGDYAYVADYGSGLQIIDISTPSSPSLVGTYDTPDSARGVYVLGDYAYVADYGSGLQIIDISTPSSPSLVGTYNTSGYAYGVYVSGDYAYIADYSSGLQIIDISTPSSPSLAGTYVTADYAHSVYASGDYVYAAVNEGGLQIIKVREYAETGTFTSAAIDTTSNESFGAVEWSGSGYLGANWQTFGTQGSGEGQFDHPSDVFVDTINNKVYVGAGLGNILLKFDSGEGGTTLGANWETFGTEGGGVNQLNDCYGVYLDVTTQKLYIADTGNNRFVKFDSGEGGTTLGANWETFGSYGSGDSQFDKPKFIYVDTENNKVYMSDMMNCRIVKFDSGEGGTTLGANWETFGSSGSGIGQFNRSAGIYVDTINYKVYATDEFNHRLHIFDSGEGGTTLGANWETIGSCCNGAGHFWQPMGIYVDIINYKIYVAEFYSHRIAKFDSGKGGTTLGANWETFGSYGSEDNQFCYPRGIKVDTLNNEIYAVDSTNNRIVKFNSGNVSSLVLKARTATTAEGLTSKGWTVLTNGSDMPNDANIVNGDQYIQYQVEMSTADTSTTPVLNSITIDANIDTISDESASVWTISNPINVTASNIAVKKDLAVYAGPYKIGDTVTVTWDNSAETGPDNPDVTAASCNFSQLEGGSSVTMYDDGTNGGDITADDDIWSAQYTIQAGTIDTTTAKVSVSATDGYSTKTTEDITDLTIDNVVPVLTEANISITSTGSGTGGVFLTGDTVTVQWIKSDETGLGSEDTISSVTCDFSSLGGPSDTNMIESPAGTWTGSYQITTSSISGVHTVTLTATDNAQNITTTENADNNIQVAPGAGLVSVSVVPASLVAGEISNVTVSLTTVNTLPSNGKIEVTFPTGFVLDSGSETTASSATMDGAFAVDVSGQVVTVTRSAGSAQTAGAESIVLTNIKNPTTSSLMGWTGTYSAETQDSYGNTIDKKTGIAGSTIVSAQTTSLTLNAPDDIIAGGVRAPYTVVRRDEFNNLSDQSNETFYLYTTSEGINAGFYDVAEEGTEVTSIDIASGASEVDFWFYDELMGAYTNMISEIGSSVEYTVGNTSFDDFSAGTLTDTEVTGTGDAAGVGLEMRIINPLELTGSYDTPDSARRVYVSGDYAYVADYASGLQIIDISTPSSPSLTGTYDTSGVFRDIYVSGAYAYVAAHGDGLNIFDISTPSSPSFKGAYDTSGVAIGVYVSGAYAYVADYESGLQIINISTPSSPSLEGTYDTPDTARSVYVSGDYAYVADGTSGLQIINISTPSSPSLEGTYDTPSTARSVYVSGDYAYVADYGSGLQIIDISTPSSPSFTGVYDTPGLAYGVYVSGDYAYVADESSGIQIVDISTPSSPTLAGTYDTPDSAWGVYVSGNYAYVADKGSGLQIIKVREYAETGTFTSAAIDTTSNESFGAVEWLADAPVGTTLAISAKTADTIEGLTSKDWVALTSGLNIPADGTNIVNGDKYIQYYVEMSTADTSTTPVLNSIDFGLNRSATGGFYDTDDINVKHSVPDRIHFSADIAGPQKAGAVFTLPSILAVDAYNNLLNNAYGAEPYEETITVSYALSGDSNAPDNNGTDSFTTSVSFANGISTTALSTILYRAQDTTVTPSTLAVGLTGQATESNAITVDPEVKNKVVFVQEPSSTGIINSALAVQPIVAIQDFYGNQTHDTDDITLYDSSSNEIYMDTLGALSADANPLAAANGRSEFSGLSYDTPGAIYLYAEASGITADFSQAISFTISSTSTVEAADTPVANFNLVPTNDSEENKFAVLKFKVADSGGDLAPTLIDRIKIAITGTGVNASTDIAWAGLYIGDTQIESVTGDAIANDYITFGALPDSESDADLYSLADNTSEEFIVYIYMKDSKLTATEGSTYVFGINESLVGIDSGLSSQMLPDTGSVASVTGMISVTVSHIEVVTSAGADSIEATAGIGNDIKLRAVDSNKNIDKNYIGNQTFKFYGLNQIGVYKPKVDTTVFGNNKTIGFTLGESGVVSLTAYMKEQDRSVTVIDQNNISYLSFGLSVDVISAQGASMAIAGGNNQAGAINAVLAENFIVTISDAFGNPATGEVVDFEIFTYPGGASGQSLSQALGDSDDNGMVSTILTLGNVSGEYQVTAFSAGLTGSPLTFTATALEPVALNIVSGNNQTDKIVTFDTSALMTAYLALGGVPVPHVDISYNIISVPNGAEGQALSADTVTTNTNGQAGVVLTLGNKTGNYVVRASVGSFYADFTITALPKAPYRIVLTGPSAVSAGEASEVFTISIKDEHDNLSGVTATTIISLESTAVSTGSFYADALMQNPLANNNITLNTTSHTASVYYKDTLVGVPTITASVTSGQTGLYTNSDNSNISVIPAGIHHFKITGSTSIMTAGDSRNITITAYDIHDNIKTDYTGQVNVIFSGAEASPSLRLPACDDTNFGEETTLNLSSGTAVTVLKLYKAQEAAIKATAGSITTSADNDLNITVKHAAYDHLKFAASLPTPQRAGVEFAFETTVDAVDLYDNICDGANGASAYTQPNKTITWALSGQSNGPQSGIDVFTNPVSFTAGRSTTTLSATLYRAQNTTIAASVVGLEGENIASNVISVLGGAVNKIRFEQQPSGSCITTRPLENQPWVSVADGYGNRIADAQASISLAASTTTGVFTPALNGTLTASALSMQAFEGVAEFEGVTYSYPENIYLRASVSGYDLSDIYSQLIQFSTAKEAVVSAGELTEPVDVSSLANTPSTKADILDFKITDLGDDGYATKIKQIIINMSEDDTAGDWRNYIAGAYITDGTTQLLAIVEEDRLVFGSGASIIYTINNSRNKTFVLSLFLKQSLPEDADKKALGFSLDADSDIMLDNLSSTFPLSSAITASPYVEIFATNFKITGSAGMLAGTSNAITLKAIDINGNIDKDYTGDKALEFSGASVSIKDNNPTCTSFAGADVNFGDITIVSFEEGVNSSAVSMKLYKAETALIKANDGTLTTSSSDALTVVVTGGEASELLWGELPVNMVVANAPWKEFTVNVADAYGNTTSSAVDVTIVVTQGGSIGETCVDTVTASSGIATFRNFTVVCPNYPGTVSVKAESSGVSYTDSTDPITVHEKYSVIVYAKDYTTGSDLTELTFDLLKDGLTMASEGFPKTGNSPFEFQLPYGTYTMSFEKEQYLTQGAEKVAGPAADALDGKYDNKIAWTIVVSSLAEATADYNVKSGITYDEAGDKLTLRLWLEKRGKLVLNDDVNKLGPAVVEIYDDALALWLQEISLAAPALNDTVSGLYYREIPSVAGEGGLLDLVSGKTYFAKCKIYYGGLEGTGRLYEGGTVFSITISQSLKEVTSKIEGLSGEIKTEVAGVKTVISSEVKEAKALIESSSEETKTAIESSTATVGERVTQAESLISSRVTQAESTISSSVTTAQTAITERVTLEGASQILNQDTHVQEGKELVIRYKTTPGLAPTIDVYDASNKLRVASQPMRETIPGVSGIYAYTVTFNWGKGSHSVICKEPVHGTLAGINVQVISTDLEDIGSTATTTMSQVSKLSKLDPEALESMGAGIESAIDVIDTISGVVEELGSLSGAMDELSSTEYIESIREQINAVAEKMREFSKEQGLKIEEMFDISEEQFQNIDYIRNKTQEIKAMIELQKEILERGSDEPVSKSWLELGE
jgi:hypothetical protein